MVCRIGITTDPDKRKKDWENQYPSLYDWKILEKCYSKYDAQNAENRFARQYGCESHPGGSGEEGGVWYVYKFSY